MALKYFAAVSTAALVVAGFVSLGTAQDVDKAQAIQDRQALMKQFGGAMKAFSTYLETGEGVETLAGHAEKLEAGAGQLPELFPAGTGIEDGIGKTAAKGEIWTDWARFEAISKTMQSEAGKLKTAAGTGDKAQIAALFADFSKNTCAACHGNFRAKK